MKNIIKSIGYFGAFMAFLFLGGLVGAQTDPTNMSEALASTTAILTSAQGPILTYILSIAGATFLITITITAVVMLIRWVKGALGGRKKRR